MRIPKKLKVLGLEYTVTVKPGLLEAVNAMGMCDPSACRLCIDSNVPEAQQADTFMHEIVEALKFALKLRIPHDDLCSLVAGLMSVIRDNKLDFRK